MVSSKTAILNLRVKSRESTSNANAKSKRTGNLSMKPDKNYTLYIAVTRFETKEIVKSFIIDVVAKYYAKARP
jgi:hypothetical protein